ncbi:LCP family protein [Agrilactobacillus fermenti]|uniref:LCP family protein n=1 Tax=Agrilactobacillus fermenti TaxID=2586909 RepID=UPI003A5C2F90
MILLSLFLCIQPRSTATAATQKPFNILLLGTDTGALGRNDRGRTDTMILATINPQKGLCHLTSIERDIPIKIAGKQLKLNSAYTVGGLKLVRAKIATLLNVTISYYAVVNMHSVTQIMQAVGKITVQNSLDFTFDHHHFTKGKLTLTPSQALSYMRMRYQDPRGDYGRQLRQQQVLKASFQKLTQQKQLHNLPKYLRIAKNAGFKTNLPLTRLAVSQVSGKGIHHIQSDQLNGTEQLINGQSLQKITSTERHRVHRQIQQVLQN